jgi:meso-butanediol dehydrogenase/(S,S)-butanediol dehydrogenase/diacetyl reductase
MTSAVSPAPLPAAMSDVAIVTGAASGIGRATAELLLSRGGRVIGVDLDGVGLAWMAGHPAARALQGDVTDPDTSARAVSVALEAFGRVDVAVLNAGRPGSGPVESYPLDAFDEMLAVNLRSVILGLRAVVPAMRATGRGSVVVTASVSGLGGEPYRWPYTVTKAAVLNLVRSTSLDLAVDGIRVNAVCPGPVHTGLTARTGADRPDRYERLRRASPMRRWGEASEVAEVIVFLASAAASYVTGVAIPVDGGLSAGTGQAVALGPGHDDGGL